MRVTPPCLPRLYPRLYSQVFPCSNSTAAAAQQHIIKKTQSQTRQRNERCTLRNPNCGTPATRRPRVRLASEPKSPPQNHRPRIGWTGISWTESQAFRNPKMLRHQMCRHLFFHQLLCRHPARCHHLRPHQSHHRPRRSATGRPLDRI